MKNNYVSFISNPEIKFNLKKSFQLSKIFSVQSWVICLLFIVVSLPQNTIAQTTLFQFNFESTLNPNIDNVNGVPTFTSNGTDTNNYTTSGSTCQGSRMWLASNWDTGDYHRFTVNTTGYTNMNFSFCDRTDVTTIGTFIVRVSSDNGASWTTVLTTFTPATSNTTRTTDIFPTQANNNTEVWIEIYKTGNSNPQNSRQLFIDAATLTGLAIPTFTPTNGCSNSGQLITITGRDFTASSTVSFNGIVAPTTFISETQLTATLPNNATTGPITVTIPGIGTVSSISNFTINPSPTAVTATASQSAICVGQNINLNSTATSNSNTATTLLSENFNGTPVGWTTTNTSTGGDTEDAAWTLRPNNYNYGGNIRSNDNSQFYFSNSDAQGSGTTRTTLVSPVFSTIGVSAASLNFYHYYRDNGNSGDFAYVEISTDGANWSTIQTYNSNQDGRTAFTNPNIPLNAYLNQPTVQIRFRYQATDDYYWAIDNVTVSSTPATPALTYAWTSNPAGYTSSAQNPTGVAPTVTTTYTVRATNNYGCWTEASTTVTVMELNSVSAASSTPTICINTALIDITHTTTGATEIGTATGLPNGVVATWNSNTITISGTPTESGTFTYSIPLIGGCGTATATGTIEVTPITNTVSDASSLTSTLCINTVLTDITHTTTGTTGIDTPTGLPAGVSATWNNNVITISGTPTESGTFNYSIPLLGCGNVIATGEIVVLDNSFVSAPSATPSLCVNSILTDITHTTTLATGIGTPIDLPNGVTASWNNDVITISGTPTVSGVYSYTIPVFGCGTADATGIITVEDSVDAAGIISGNSIVCQGETNVIYTVPSIEDATNYIWNLPTGATITSGENTNSITVSFSTIAESGIITVQGSNSCGNGTISADFVVTVNTLPSNAGIINGNTLVCQGQTGVVYTITPIVDVVTYNWSLPTGATIVSGANTNSITVDFANNALSGNISVYGSNSCGNGLASDTFDVTVDIPSEAPTSISGTATICEGTSTTLTLVGGVQGTNATAEWFTDTCGGIAVGTGNSITVSPIITTTYYVRYNGNCNITDCASITVNVDPLPVAAGSFTTSSTTVCEGQTNVVYTIPAIDNATNYIWTVPTGFDIIGVTNTNSITVNITSSAVSGDITVYGNNACGDGSSSSVSVTVNPLPVAAGTITGTAIVCQGQNGVVYSVPTIDHATTYNWTVPTGASIVSGNGTNTITINFLGNAISGNITVQGQNGCGTGTISANYPITVNVPSVAPTSITGTTTICEGTSTTLTMVGGSAGTGATIEWFSTSCGGTFVGNGNSITVSPTTTTTYYVRYSGDCNTTACASITVNVNPLPVAAGAISGQNTVCQGETHTYTVTPIANATQYIWTIPSGLTVNTGTSNSVIVTFDLAATSGNITVHGYNTCGVGTTSSLAITVNSSPYIAKNYTSEVCSGETVTVIPLDGDEDNIIPPATTYSWVLLNSTGGITGITSLSNQPHFIQTLTNTTGTTQTASYTVTAVTNGCSTSNFNITVTVNPKPTVAATPSPASVCSGLNFNVALSNPNAISGNINYNWTRNSVTGISGMTSGSGDISGIMTNSTSSPITVTFTVIATTEEGCNSNPFTVNITVNPTPTIEIISNQNVCSGEPFNLAIIGTNSITGTTYSWTRSSNSNLTGMESGTGNPINGIITNNSSMNQTTTFTITATANGCNFIVGSFEVTVKPKPTVTALPLTQTICSGTPITNIILSSNSGTTFSWTSSDPTAGISNGSGTQISGTLNNMTSSNQNITFSITTSVDGCDSTTTATITVQPQPQITITNNAQVVCRNTAIVPIVISSNLGGTISWSRTNSNISGIPMSGIGTSSLSISGTLTHSQATTQTDTITVTVTAPNGCSSTTTFTITVYALLVAPVIGDSQDVCYISGGVMPLYMTTPVSGGSGNFTYQWQRSTTGANPWNNVGTNNDTFTPNAEGYYRLIITDNNCPSQNVTSNSNIRIRLIGVSFGSPNITAGAGPHTVCNGSTLPNISVNVGHSFLSDVKFNHSINNSYVVSTANQAVGTTTGFIAETTSWTFNNTFTANNTTNATQTSIISITPRIDNFTGTCNASSATVTVYTRPTPRVTLSTVNPNNPVACHNSTRTIRMRGNITDGAMIFNTQIVGTLPAGVTTTATLGDSGSIAQNTNFDFPVTFTNTTGSVQAVTFRVTPRSNYGSNDCPGVSSDITIYVVPDFDATTIASDETICIGDTALLSGADTGIGYQWQQSTNGGTSWSNLNGATNHQYQTAEITSTRLYQRIETRNFTIAAGNVSCSAVSNPIQVTINNVTPRAINGADRTICTTGATTINAQTSIVSGTLSYQWESSVDADACNTGTGFSEITLNGNGQNYIIPEGLTVITYFRRKTISTLNGKECFAYSNCIAVTPNNVNAGTIVNDQTICRGDTPSRIKFDTASLPTGDGTLTYQWQVSSTGCNGSWSTTGMTGQTSPFFDPPALNATRYYRVAVTSTLNGQSCTVYTNCITITVNPAVSPGTISSNRTICEGGIPIPLTGTSTADSYQWQSSVDGINFSDIVGAIDTGYSPGAIFQTTHFRRIAISTVNGINCTSSPSNIVTVTVNTITPPVIAVNGSSSFCASTNPNEFTIVTPATGSGTLRYQWQNKTVADCSIDADWINISGATSSTYNPATITQTTYYRVIVTVNNMCPVYSNCIEITSLGKTWNGSVSTDWYNDNNWTPNGVPDATNCVIIPNVANDPIIEGTNTDAYALNLTILTGGSLEVNSTNNITVTDFVNVNATGLFDIKNNASLIQINDNAVNVGNIKYSRTSRPMTRYAYVYWGSPVEENVIGQIPSQFDLKYRWEPNTGVADGTWLALSTTVPGEGFITRVRNVAPFSTGIGSIPFTFTGKPNNGIINVNVSSFDNSSMVSANTALLANPYPSTIDAEEFLTHPNNTELGGTLSFWTSVTLYSGTGPYNVQDYASWNLTGGTITSNAPATDSSDDLRPNGKIASGQGFFAQVFADGQITFNNAMRQSGSNSQFYRTGNSTEKHRIWVNLFDQNKFRQTLIGYVSGATNEFDRLYDGDAFTSNEINIYSILDDHALVIQGRALPFDDNDIIPLGYKITTAGTYNIGIDEIDGVFAENQNVYLKDKLLNIIHDIKASNYSFSTASGTFDDRFEIVFRNGSLGIDNPDSTLAQAYIKDQTLYINASKNIEEIILYDVAGKRLKKFKNDIPTTSFKTEFNYPNGIYIAKVKMDDRTIVNVKIGN